MPFFSYRQKSILPLTGAILACFIFTSTAFAEDIHDWFENHCGGCHQHAGELAREKLTLVDGILKGATSGRDIRSFLPSHYGRPNPAETAALYELLLWQKQAGGAFKARCAICHDRARTLAQNKLLQDKDILYGRYTGRDMSEFLIGHGRIDPAEVDFFIELLTRLAPTAPSS